MIDILHIMNAMLCALLVLLAVSVGVILWALLAPLDLPVSGHASPD